MKERYDRYLQRRNQRESERSALLVNSLEKDGDYLKFKRGPIVIGSDEHKCGNKRYKVPADQYTFSVMGTSCRDNKTIFKLWEIDMSIPQAPSIVV